MDVLPWMTNTGHRNHPQTHCGMIDQVRADTSEIDDGLYPK